MINLDLYDIKNICMDMAELGAANYAKMTTPGEDILSQRQAYRQFGESRVKRWVDDGIVAKVRVGKTKQSKIIYSKAELISVEKSERLNKIINK